MAWHKWDHQQKVSGDAVQEHGFSLICSNRQEDRIAKNNRAIKPHLALGCTEEESALMQTNCWRIMVQPESEHYSLLPSITRHFEKWCVIILIINKKMTKEKRYDHER